MTTFSRDLGTGEIAFVETFNNRRASEIQSIQDIAASPDGERLYATDRQEERLFTFRRNTDGTLRLVETDSLDFSLGFNEIRIALSPDSNHAYVAARALTVAALEQRECAPSPLLGCKSQLLPSGKLVLKQGVQEKSDRVNWTWLRGEETLEADLGSPDVDTSFLFCVYDETAGVPSLVGQAFAPAGGICGRKDCWKPLGNPPGSRGYKFTHRSAGRGIRVLRMTPGEDLRPRITVTGAGVGIEMPSLPLNQDTAVRAQLVGSNVGCWETHHAAPASKNTDNLFRDTGD